MVSQGTQSRAGMGNSQTVLACHCIARLFLREICFLILGAQTLTRRVQLFLVPARRFHDPALRTPGRSCLRFSEGCLCDAHSLTLSGESRPFTNVYSPSFQAGKCSRNFTNQRQRWSRRAFQNHKPFTSVGKSFEFGRTMVPGGGRDSSGVNCLFWLRFRFAETWWYASSGLVTMTQAL